eukprot:8018171-Alexandrium_andersonii.AAC.1
MAIARSLQRSSSELMCLGHTVSIQCAVRMEGSVQLSLLRRQAHARGWRLAANLEQHVEFKPPCLCCFPPNTSGRAMAWGQ